MAVFRGAFARDEDDGLRASISRSSVSVFEAGTVGQMDVENDHVGMAGRGPGRALGGAFGGNQVDVGGAKGALKGVADGGFVID